MIERSYQQRNVVRMLTFLTCVLIASLLWLTIKLRHKYTVDVSIPITYTNLQSASILKSQLPSSITVTLTGDGWSIWMQELQHEHQVLSIDVNDVVSHLETSTSLPTQPIVQQLFKEKTHIRIDAIVPSRINFVSTPLIEKKLPIHTITQFKLPLYSVLLDSVQWSSKTVLVKGPKSVLDTLNVIHTAPTSISIQQHQIQYSIPLKVPHPDVVLKTNSINAYVYTDVLIEEDLDLPLKLSSDFQGYHYSFMPSKVKVRYLVPSQKSYSKTNFCPVEVVITPTHSSPYVVPEVHSESYVKHVKLYPNVVSVYEIKEH